ASIKYHLSPRIVVTMSSTSDLVVGGNFTTVTGVGVIKQLAGNVVEVEMTSGYLVSGQNVVATGSPTITDLTYKNSIHLFPAQASSIGNFSIGSYISSPASQGSSLGIVTQLLPDSIVVNMIRGTFAPSETLDNTAT